MIHSGKVFKSVRGGVRILDCHTMQWRFVANSHYVEDKLSEIFDNRRVRIKANNIDWVVSKSTFPAEFNKIKFPKVTWETMRQPIGYFPFRNVKKGDLLQIKSNV